MGSSVDFLTEERMPRITFDVREIADQAIRYVRSNPCSIFCFENSRTHECNAGVKYKGTCKVNRTLRRELWKLKTSDEREHE